MKTKGHLHLACSKSYSGDLLKESLIPYLTRGDYHIIKKTLIGDAPKEFMKAYFYERDSTIRKRNTDSWDFFIAKTAEKWYPRESVIEFLINRIGQEIGLNINDIRLVNCDKQIRFLSRYFINDNEKLVHGAEICGEYLSDMGFAEIIAHSRHTSRELFTFEFIQKAINSVYPAACVNILNGLVKLIIFDGLIGNNDRHFYNWGVIDTIRKNNKMPTFAPIFDSARGLFWNYSDQQLIHHYAHANKNGKFIERYLDKAYPRISIEKNKKANHFELIKFLKEESVQYKDFIIEMSSEDNEQKILKNAQRRVLPFVHYSEARVDYTGIKNEI